MFVRDMCKYFEKEIPNKQKNKYRTYREKETYHVIFMFALHAIELSFR